MGSNQSNLKFTEVWPTEYSNYKTYTLPRYSQRSHSLTSQGYESAHPDDKSEPCRLIKMTQHRLSRSHSLDDGRELSSWAIKNLMIIDEAHGISSQFGSLENKADKIAKEENEFVNHKCKVREVIAMDPTNEESKFQNIIKYNSNKSNISSHSDGELTKLGNKSSAQTIEDLKCHNTDNLDWIDQDESSIVNLTYNTRIEALIKKKGEKTSNCIPEKSERILHHSKSDTDISNSFCIQSMSIISDTENEKPLSKSPSNDISDNMILNPNTPEFTAKSWEALPPDEEMEVMEIKPILEAINEPLIVSLGQKVRSRSLNSSLSSLSLLSAPDEFSECEVGSSFSGKAMSDAGFYTEDFSPDVFFDPTDMRASATKAEASSPVVDPSIPISNKIETCSTESIHDNIKTTSIQSNEGDYIHPVKAKLILNDNVESSTEITGVLQIKPISSSSSNNQIILSVSIPQRSSIINTEKLKRVEEFTIDSSQCPLNDEYIVSTKYTNKQSINGYNMVEDQIIHSANKMKNICNDSNNIPILHNDKKSNNKKATYSSSETLSDTNDFLREVQTRIPPSPSERADNFYPKYISFLQDTSHNSFSHNVSTQTSPLRSPTCCSPSYSFTWLGDCKCDTYSIEPCVSSVGLSTPEDDLDELQYTKAVWSDDGSVSSSPPETPVSPLREDSPLSLSASLDYLEQNVESGIGTASTSPPTNFGSLDFSGSNLSSEDAGMEGCFEKRLRRYQPNTRGHRSSSHSLQYRKKRNRLRLTEQWNGREHQMTQTDFLTPDSETCSNYNRNVRASSEEARVLNSPKRDKSVRQTISEPRLGMKLSHNLKLISSEASLPPLPLPKSVATPVLPTVSENITKPKPISRPTNLPLFPQVYPCSKKDSHSSEEVKMRRRHLRSNSSITSSNSSFSAGKLPSRIHSTKELSELEAVEACKWLRAAGFPQYAQMYEDFQFPLDLLSVERDHSFLDRDSIHALFRRLKILNRCARIRIDSAKKTKITDSDEDQECALSGNWEFQADSRRWSRVDPNKVLISDDQKSNDNDRKRGTSETSEDLTFGQFKRSGSERLRDGAKAILRRMESLKSKKKRKHRDGIIISSPTILDDINMQARMEELGCVDLSPDNSPQIHSREGVFTLNKKNFQDIKQNIGGEDSSSMASDHSQGSLHITRSRRRRKIWSGRKRFGENSGAYSDSECSPPAWRHEFNHSSNNDRPLSSNRDGKFTPEKVSGSRRRTELRHATSLTYGKDSQRVREKFLSSLRNNPKSRLDTLPNGPPNSDRHSIYDNVPLVICNKNYYDFHNDVRDVEMITREGSASSECTLESRESPFPSTQEDEDTDDRPSRRNTQDRWHSFNKKSPPYATFREFSTHINGFSVGQMNHLRKRALLRLTALMERYCAVNRTAWNWELPKFMRKLKTPDYKDRLIFGVPLQTVNQRIGQPLHPVILRAFNYIRTSCLDQVGIFRKPGVRTRIQKLREMHEFGEEIDYDNYCPCDIADMIKTYFRELPEVLLTNKLSGIFITICQYLPAETRVEALQCAMLMMPDENRETLMALLIFLSDVAQHSHLNQMTANNLAVCMAPSLFHFNLGGGSSPLRKRATGTPEQKDLHDNKAAHQCLSLMIVEVTKLMSIPIEMFSNCRFSYLDNSQPVALEDLGTNYSNGLQTNAGDWSSYMTACISSLLKETREKNRGWVHVNNSDSMLDISYRKVGDGHPLRLLKVSTEVEAPPTELITRIVRERHLWDESLVKWRVVCKLNKQAEIFQYLCSSMPQRPSIDFCVLRYWKTDVGNRVCVFVETSIEHSECPPIDGCLRGIVLASRYLIQPCGSGKSRITHLSRIDMRGRLPEWYNKVYPFIAALRLSKLRDSFQHSTSGPESNV